MAKKKISPHKLKRALSQLEQKLNSVFKGKSTRPRTRRKSRG